MDAMAQFSVCQRCTTQRFGRAPREYRCSFTPTCPPSGESFMSERTVGRAVFPGSFSARDGVLIAEGTTGLDYTDGATVEDRMLQQVSAASDLSVLSPELRALITDWPTRYLS